MFSPQFDLRIIRINVHRVRNCFFRPGECKRMVLGIFREAQGAAPSSRQIGETLTTNRGVEATTVMIEPMRKNAIGVGRCLPRTGTLVVAGRGDGHGATWAVA